MGELARVQRASVTVCGCDVPSNKLTCVQWWTPVALASGASEKEAEDPVDPELHLGRKDGWGESANGRP